MARGQGICPQFPGTVKKASEFDFPIAGQAGVGSLPFHIGGDKIVHHLLFKDLPEVQGVNLEAQLLLKHPGVHGLGFVAGGKVDAKYLLIAVFNEESRN